MGRESDSPKVIPGGAPIPDTTAVSIYRRTDLVTPVASTTIASGKYVHQYDGSYGPIQTRITYNAETRVRDSVAIGQAGPINFGDFVFWMAGWGNGVARGVRNQLQVTAGGAGKTVLVRSGAGAAAGIVYNQFTDNKTSPVFADNASGNPRIDLIGFQVWTPGHAEEGRAELAILQGTPAAVPVAPTPTQVAESGTWFQPLAQISLPNGYSSISIGQITDLRPFLFDNTEIVNDAILAAIVCGAGVTCVVNDPANTVTINQDIPSFTNVDTSTALGQNVIVNLDATCPGTHRLVNGGYFGSSIEDTSNNHFWAAIASGPISVQTWRCTFQKGSGLIGVSVTCRAWCMANPV